MIAILTAIIGIMGIFIGAYINNVLTWKIKNKIEALDCLYNNLSICNVLLSQMIALHSINKDDIENIHKNDLEIEKNCIFVKETSSWLEKYTASLGVIDFANAVLNKRFFEQIEKYKKIFNDLFLKINYPNSLDDFDQLKGVFDDILSYRQELTSFKYILQELNPFKCRCQK